jgi:nucleoside-diphosphate-sugar epimerase
MTVVITGANGFVGTRTARLLAADAAGPKLKLLSRRASRRPGTVVVDLLDPRAVRSAVEGCDAVIHCAFDFQDLASNFDIAIVLAEACRVHGVRLVHLSTAAVHEPLPVGDMDETHDPSAVGTDYKKIKLHIEHLLLRQSKYLGLDLVILQPTVIYGPFGRAWTDSPIRELLTGTVILPNEGEGLCNAVYIDDVCQAAIDALTAPHVSGTCFLINGPGPVTWKDFYTAYRDMLGVGTISLAPISDTRASDGWGQTRPERPARSAKVKASVVRLLGSRTVGQIQLLVGFVRGMIPGGTIHRPTGAKLALLGARCRIRSDKARQCLGYEPRYDLRHGMDLTAPYVRRAYGRLARVKAFAAGYRARAIKSDKDAGLLARDQSAMSRSAEN